MYKRELKSNCYVILTKSTQFRPNNNCRHCESDQFALSVRGLHCETIIIIIISLYL